MPMKQPTKESTGQQNQPQNEPLNGRPSKQPDKQQVINGLNRFLQGRYMGIHHYEQLIAHAKNPELKKMLQDFQEHAKLGAQQAARRIQDLGGVAVDGGGITGEIREWMSKLDGFPEETEPASLPHPSRSEIFLQRAPGCFMEDVRQ